MTNIIEGVAPTRMELLEMNKKIKLAKKGHKLLKEKRDSLVTEFFGVVEKARGSRAALSRTMSSGYPDLIKAEAIMGTANVEDIAGTIPEKGEINITSKNVMGVRIPQVNLTLNKHEYDEKIRGSVYSSSKLYDASEKFDKAYDELIRLAETEETIRRLGEEIKKTKRRVNSLEYIMIPRLGATKRYITSRLEEMERESFFRLKMVKRKKQREVQ